MVESSCHTIHTISNLDDQHSYPLIRYIMVRAVTQVHGNYIYTLHHTPSTRGAWTSDYTYTHVAGVAFTARRHAVLTLSCRTKGSLKGKDCGVRIEEKASGKTLQ